MSKKEEKESPSPAHPYSTGGRTAMGSYDTTIVPGLTKLEWVATHLVAGAFTRGPVQEVDLSVKLAKLLLEECEASLSGEEKE